MRGENNKKDADKDILFCAILKWVEMDSNHRRRKPADLQSAPFGHSGIHPVRECLSFLRQN